MQYFNVRGVSTKSVKTLVEVEFILIGKSHGTDPFVPKL